MKPAKVTGAEMAMLMLRLQGEPEDQLRWLAASIGRLWSDIDKLKAAVAKLKAANTRLKRKRVTT